MTEVTIEAIWLLAPTVALRRLLVIAPKDGTVPVTPRKLEKKLAVPVRGRESRDNEMSFARCVPSATSSLFGLMA